jgi:hypothetical protein
MSVEFQNSLNLRVNTQPSCQNSLNFGVMYQCTMRGKKRHAPDGAPSGMKEDILRGKWLGRGRPTRFYVLEREKKAVPRCHLNCQLSLIREST